MKVSRRAGSTSNILQIFIQDSTSTTGAGLTGLAFGTSGLTAYYHRDTDTTATAISLVTMTVGTFTSSGFKEIDSTNMPGWYQFCPPDAGLTTGAKSVGFHLKGATNMVPLAIEIDLDCQVDTYLWLGTVVATPATAGVPDVNAKAINNVAATSVTTIAANVGTTQPVNFTGTAGAALAKIDVIDWNSTAVATPATAGVAEVNVKNINNVAATSVTTINANIGTTQPVNFTSTAANALVKVDVIDIAGTASQGAAGYVGIDWAKVTNPTSTVGLSGTTVGTITTYTGNTVQTGDSFARLGVPAGASVSADIAAVKSDTGTILTDVNTGAGAIYTRLGAPAGASMSADIAAINAKTTNLPAAPASTTNITAGTITTVTSVTNIVTANTTQLAGQTVVAAGSVTFPGHVASGVPKNVALNNFAFPMFLGATPVTGLTVTAQRSIDGGAFSNCANGVSELSGGVYLLNLATTDLNGSVIVLKFTATGADERVIVILTSP